MNVLFWFLLLWLACGAHIVKGLLWLLDAWQRWWTWDLEELL